MTHKLSVIMPCYNCQATLEEAVASIYTQDLRIPFEVVMVDDGSTDGTRDLMAALSQKYPHIRTAWHDRNRGGGAARNTAVEHSDGDLIFCLDSDDVLTPGVLDRMVESWTAKQCDAIGISRSIKFKGRNQQRIAYVTDFDYVDERIPFESLLDGSNCPLYSTFLHTRAAFDVVGGYPTAHGFDTQGFAFRFLANGLDAYGCPDTTYMHRVDFHQSYYVREYEAGKASFNWFCIFEEFLFLFDRRVKESLLNYDVYRDTSHDALITKNVIHPLFPELYTPNYRELLRPGIADHMVKSLEHNRMACDKFDLYWLGWAQLQHGDWQGAADSLAEAIFLGLDSVHAYRHLLDALGGANDEDGEAVIQRLQDTTFARNRFGPSLSQKVILKLRVWSGKLVG